MRKCSEMLGDVGRFVDWSAVFVKTVFEASFGFSNVLSKATIALYLVNMFSITVNVISSLSCFACGMECVSSLSVSNEGRCRTVVATSIRTQRLILLRGIV